MLIVNFSLDNTLMKYYFQKTNQIININKKNLLNIEIKYNNKYKTTIEEIIEKEPYYKKNNKTMFLNINNENNYCLFEDIKKNTNFKENDTK